MTKYIERRARSTEQAPVGPRKDSSLLLPSQIAGEAVRGSCGWCLTYRHDGCVRNMRPDVVCKCPCDTTQLED